MKKQEAVHQALQAALDSWNWRPPSPHVVGHSSEPPVEPGVRTELSTTVFSGEAKEWLRYLSLPASARFARKFLERKPKVLNVFEDLLFANARRAGRSVHLRLSPDVPSDGTREVPRDGVSGLGETRIVLHSRLTRYIHEALVSRARSPEEVL